MSHNAFKSWRVPLGLFLFGFVSVLLGSVQLNDIATLTTETAPDYESRHYLEMPIPIVIHIITGVLLNLFLPLQFASGIRTRWPQVHRWSGRILALCVVLASVTSLWMNEFYPAFGGTAKYLGVIVHSVIALVGIAWAIKAVREGRIQRHKIAMMCMTAAILSPSTQRFVIIPMYIALGGVNDLMIGSVMWFGLLFNLSVVALVVAKTHSKRIAEAKPLLNTEMGV